MFLSVVLFCFYLHAELETLLVPLLTEVKFFLIISNLECYLKPFILNLFVILDQTLMCHNLFFLRLSFALVTQA